MANYDEHMFREHSPAELVGWTHRLSYFRFVRAQGGQAQDGDRLVAGVHLRSDFKVVDALTSLGWSNDATRNEEIKARPDGIWFRIYAKAGDPGLFQNSSVRLRSEKKFLVFEISGESGDPYSVTEADVRLAEELEKILKHLNFALLAPFYSWCFSEKTFPQYFQS
jgi:hypothetical protein